MSAVAAPGLERGETLRTRVAVIQRIVPETPESATFWTSFRDPRDRATYRFLSGQFNMLYLFGVGEVPISISSDPAHPERLAHTVRFAGRVTGAFRDLRPGHEIGIRGPFGRPWPLEEAYGKDLVVVAGGVGVCPVRPAAEFAMRHRDRYRRVLLLIGARTPRLLPYRDQLEDWKRSIERRGVELLLTVDEADEAWPHGVGVVTVLFRPAGIDPAASTVFMCGPEIMMRVAGRGLVKLGVPPNHIYVSLERNMQCAVRLCGHCQFGPRFVCADGPIFRYDEVADLLEVNEL